MCEASNRNTISDDSRREAVITDEMLFEGLRCFDALLSDFPFVGSNWDSSNEARGEIRKLLKDAYSVMRRLEHL
jgi:hypothetical protein